MQPLSHETLDAATRALARSREVQAPYVVGEMALARGEADHTALMARYHDAGVHARLRPDDVQAGPIFDALEEARVDSLGGAAYIG